MKTFKLPEQLNISIEKALKNISVDISNSKYISDCILKMSDFYIQNPSSKTPWNEVWCQVAQIAYYLPLNYLRACYVMEELKNLEFPFSKSYLEVGSGLGALTLHLESLVQENKISNLKIVEISDKAIALWKAYFSLSAQTEYQNKKINSFENSGVCFSYSLTEDIFLNLKQADSVLIIEPSTHQDARKLQEFRQKLVDMGFYIWAPCVHQKECPLLLHSKKDWCHHRIHTEMPEWFINIEKNLPFKNKTLTFSYLAASKLKSNLNSNMGRVIGDILVENGKSKALFCRSNEREFLVRMHKVSKEFPYSRGDRVELPELLEKKSNEIRI